MVFVNAEPDLALLCGHVKLVAMEAGAITMEYFGRPVLPGLDAKADGSPFSLADTRAEDHIAQRLTALTPHIPVIGEEAKAQGAAPKLGKSRFSWRVDPLDGTKEFIAGKPDFTVNIALIDNGVPVMGIVYVPVQRVLYAGYANTATRWDAATGVEKPIHTRKPPEEGLTVVSSASHGDAAKMESLLKLFNVKAIVKFGSSLKMCKIAEGEADFYPRFGLTCEWDTADADAILRAAGGFITDFNGKPLRYEGQDPDFYNPEFFASGGVACPPVKSF